MESCRERLLQDLGIEVWRQRQRQQTPTANLAPRQPAPTDTAPPPPVEPLAPARPVPERPRATRSTRAATDARSDQALQEEALSATALCIPGTVLLTGALANRAELRLAQDIVRAATGNWRAQVRRLSFNWPLPGLRGSARSSLAAFIDKQAQDYRARMLLVVDSLTDRVSSEMQTVSIPDLSGLHAGEARQSLWRRLQILHQDAGGGATPADPDASGRPE